NHLTRQVDARGGIASFGRLYPDDVVLTAALGQDSSAPQTVTLRERLTVVELALEQGGSLSVTVVDDSGQPVAAPELSVLTRTNELVAKKKARTGDLVAFGPLGEGEYLLRGVADGYKQVDLPVRVAAREQSVELVMPKGTIISGRVIDEYGRPAPGISILVTPTGDSVLAGADGHFSAQVPTPGLYQLHAHHSDWGGGTAQVNAPAS